MNLKLFMQLLFQFHIDLYFSKYQIGDNSNNVIELKNTRLVSSSSYEYFVFNYLDYVIKIHKNYHKNYEGVNENILKSLRNKKTKRILMPDDLVYDSKTSECSGYTMPFIKNKKSLIEESMDHFLNEVALIWGDAHYLTEELVLLDDLSSDGNFIYNGHINITDCGQYNDCHICMPAKIFENIKFPEGSRYEDVLENKYKEILNQIRIKNNESINKLILTILLNEYVFEYREQIEKYIQHLMKEFKINNVDEFIEITKEPDMTVNEYVEHLATRLNRGV